MNRIELFIGTEKDKHNQDLSADQKYYALQQTRDLLVRTYGGFTETHVLGGWKGPDGRVVVEAGLKYDVFSASAGMATVSIGHMIREFWNQSAVLLVFNGNAEFLS